MLLTVIIFIVAFLIVAYCAFFIGKGYGRKTSQIEIAIMAEAAEKHIKQREPAARPAWRAFAFGMRFAESVIGPTHSKVFESSNAISVVERIAREGK